MLLWGGADAMAFNGTELLPLDLAEPASPAWATLEQELQWRTCLQVTGLIDLQCLGIVHIAGLLPLDLAEPASPAWATLEQELQWCTCLQVRTLASCSPGCCQEVSRGGSCSACMSRAGVWNTSSSPALPAGDALAAVKVSSFILLTCCAAGPWSAGIRLPHSFAVVTGSRVQQILRI